MSRSLPEAMEAWRASVPARLAGIADGARRDWLGRVASVGDGVAYVTGLPYTRAEELLAFPGGTMGLAQQLGESSIGCVLLGDAAGVAAGDIVHGTGEVSRVPVGDAVLGRVLDPLGRPLDGEPAPKTDRHEPIERPAPPIVDRAPVVEPLLTGIGIVDAMLPIGRGQRELIIGDRQTGKTSLAVDAIISQHGSDVVSIYVAIGQKTANAREIIELVRSKGSPERTLFVIAGPDDPPGLQWIAPFAAMTMAEHFRDSGRHALIVLDDLTRHAAVHRQIALLLRSPPGREAYPGDIFYLHARLLERAAKLAPEAGGGSLTALPIAETQAGNLSAYIPTNLISITDGQIHLDTRLFGEGQKPAVDIGRSVSRVGAKSQAPALRHLAERLRLDYAQFLELEVFSRFGTVADERMRQTLEHGRRMRALLNQPRLAVRSQSVQIATLLALNEKVLAALPLAAIARFRDELPAALVAGAPRVLDRLDRGEDLGDADRDSLLKIARTVAGALGPAS